MRGALEHQRNFGHAAAKALAGTQVERDASPATRVDIESDGRIGFSGGIRVDALLLQIPHNRTGALPAC